MSSIGSCQLGSIEESMPYVIREGVFGATVHVNEEPLFLRMELLTKKNTNHWNRFKRMSCWIANQNSRGVLSGLVSLAGKANYPKYDKEIIDVTGFTNDEYVLLTEKAIRLKNKTNNKIVDLLNANSVGINHMSTSAEGLNYVVYISKNRDFSILDQGQDVTGEGFTLKNFINSYSDILISVGSNFSGKNSFHNRGVSRNPHWVFEEKYAGLSMLLHSLPCVVASRFFPEKEEVHIKPVGSMQSIIKKSLLPGEGYLESGGEKIDLTTIEVLPTDPEGAMNYIKISALIRIYLDKVTGTKK